MEAQKWLFKAGGCLLEVNISAKLNENILFCCLRQVGYNYLLYREQNKTKNEMKNKQVQH